MAGKTGVNKMGKLVVWALVVSVLSGMHLGTILRRNETRTSKNQTDPIALKDKLEELKDGPKGAPKPSLKLYAGKDFLVDPPIDETQSSSKVEDTSLESISEVDAVYNDHSSEDWWAEGDETLEQDFWDIEEQSENP